MEKLVQLHPQGRRPGIVFWLLNFCWATVCLANWFNSLLGILLWCLCWIDRVCVSLDGCMTLSKVIVFHGSWQVLRRRKLGTLLDWCLCFMVTFDCSGQTQSHARMQVLLGMAFVNVQQSFNKLETLGVGRSDGASSILIQQIGNLENGSKDGMYWVTFALPVVFLFRLVLMIFMNLMGNFQKFLMTLWNQNYGIQYSWGGGTTLQNTLPLKKGEVSFWQQEDCQGQVSQEVGDIWF